MSSQRPANIPDEDWQSVNNELARISGAGSGGGIPLDQLITAKPEDLGNDANLEILWAEKVRTGDARRMLTLDSLNSRSLVSSLCV